MRQAYLNTLTFTNYSYFIGIFFSAVLKWSCTLQIVWDKVNCACCVWFHLYHLCVLLHSHATLCVSMCVLCIVCIRSLFACLTSYLPCLNTEPALDPPKPRTLSAYPSVTGTALQPVEERPTSLLPIPTLHPTDSGLGCRHDGESATGQSCSTLTPSEGADTRQLLRTPMGQQRTWLHCQSVLLCHNTDSLNYWSEDVAF